MTWKFYREHNYCSSKWKSLKFLWSCMTLFIFWFPFLKTITDISLLILNKYVLLIVCEYRVLCDDLRPGGWGMNCVLLKISLMEWTFSVSADKLNNFREVVRYTKIYKSTVVK